MKDIKYLGAIGYSVRKDRQLTNYCEQSVKLYVLVRKWTSKEIITIGPSFHCCLNTAAEEIPKQSNHWFVYNVFRKKYRHKHDKSTSEKFQEMEENKLGKIQAQSQGKWEGLGNSFAFHTPQYGILSKLLRVDCPRLIYGILNHFRPKYAKSSLVFRSDFTKKIT